MSEHAPPPDSDLPLETIEPGSRFAGAHRILVIFLALVVAVWLLSGIYQVKADEVAIVERLGAFLTTPEGKVILEDQGLHYHLPWPIDTVHRISVQQTRTLTINAFNMPKDSQADIKLEALRRGEPSALVNAKFDPYLITADKNVVHVEIAITYRVEDPESWITSISHSAESENADSDQRGALLQQIAQSTLTSQLAIIPVDRIFFEGRAAIVPILTKALQDAMILHVPDPEHPEITRQIDLGAQIQKVDIVNVRAPDWVQPYFDAVGQARAQMETTVLQAKSARDAAVAKAKGQASASIAAANGYAHQVIDSATGEASRFGQIYQQYKLAPDVTRWNVFVDGVTTLTANAKRLFFANPGQRIYLPADPIQFDANQVTTRPN